MQALPSLQVVPFGLSRVASRCRSPDRRCRRRGTGRSPCRPRGSSRCTCRSGRCRSGCRRCRRCRSCRSSLAGLEQVPVAGLHVPASWHWSLAVQTTGFEPVHVPLWQVSVCVQALPSLQVVPFGFARVRAGAVGGIAGAGVVALVARRADDGVRAGARAALAGVGLSAGVAVVQVVPFVFAGLLHWPVEGLQVPAPVALVEGDANHTCAQVFDHERVSSHVSDQGAAFLPSYGGGSILAVGGIRVEDVSSIL